MNRSTVKKGSKLQALARDPRALLFAGAAAVGVIYLRRSQAPAADAGTPLPVSPDSLGSAGDPFGASGGAAGGTIGDTPVGPGDAGIFPGEDVFNPTPPPDSVPAGPNAVAAGFWWGGKFWRPGDRAAFEAFAKSHGRFQADRFYSQHPGAAALFGLSPPPKQPGRPAQPVGLLARAATRANGAKLSLPNLPRPGSRSNLRRATLLRGGVTVHAEPRSPKRRGALPVGQRKATPKVDPAATRRASVARLNAHGGKLAQLPKKVRQAVVAPAKIKPGPAAKLLALPAGPSTQPHRAAVKAVVAAKKKAKKKK